MEMRIDRDDLLKEMDTEGFKLTKGRHTFEDRVTQMRITGGVVEPGTFYALLCPFCGCRKG
jgi:hypothetical protein